MLHDWDRNEKYEAGIKSALDEMRRRGVKARVLDIGTGTGLLSMMACRHGADDVIACEAFLPMASVAEATILANGFADKIRVIRKRSTAMTAAEDMEGRRANVLVTEVFDTELIGEGAIETFKHALDNLLEEDCIVVPSLARMYVQVVSSDLVWAWHRLRSLSLGRATIAVPPEAAFPCGAVFHDLQLSEIPSHAFTALSPKLEVFRFDFSGKTRLLDDRTNVTSFRCGAGGVAHAVFMWWDLQMDVEGKVWIDMTPTNVAGRAAGGGTSHVNQVQSAAARLPWRDHWMQAIYFLSNELRLGQGQSASLTSTHDAYSLTFDLHSTSNPDATPKSVVSPPVFSRSRLGHMNCRATRAKFVTTLEKVNSMISGTMLKKNVTN
jgi:protein arginine N-methyltransferase 7